MVTLDAPVFRTLGDMAPPYERLHAWRECHELALAVYRATKSFPAEERYGLTSQTRRASFSAAVNIVEGSARRSSREFRRFLDISLSSLTEVGYALRFARETGLLPDATWAILNDQQSRARFLTWQLYRSVARRELSPTSTTPPPTASRSALGYPTPHPALHDVQIHHGVPARSVGEPHREPQHRQLAGDVPQAGRHVALARHGHHGPRAPLADDTPRQLPPSRHEHRHLIASGDRQHAIQGLFGEAARDQHQQLALPHRAPAALGEGVVDVDRGVLRPVPPTEQAGEVGGKTHDVQVWPALEQPLRQQQHASIKGKEQQREPQRARAGRDRQRAPQQRRQRGQHGREPRGEQEDQRSDRTEAHRQGQRGEPEKQPGR